ncbi:SRPBCC domain-containing protein [Aurantiacibacter poecillastricola]|uniref:SRPBCC domain-containing protein n=1 Tax=Aurantiacibacter poecillastricola TaxID=3064385 RepID=UPI00273D060F|nr:SRPBCC family protein [Aurantiacibacter sp. 219JJ12-13]MDP5261626.1 SRPBCC family protein [Aurantiacibacter sp. 219JJ12-13]
MRHTVVAILAALVPAHAAAEVVESSGGGFATHDSVIVAADRAVVWEALVHPEDWWTHTWSNDASNLSLDARAGGCFCETIPATGDWPAGSVEHMRVIAVMPGSTLRMSGALGPLQSEGLAGTLTVSLHEVEQGTRIDWDYLTAGEARFSMDEVAPVVDTVQSEFLAALAARIGGVVETD